MIHWVNLRMLPPLLLKEEAHCHKGGLSSKVGQLAPKDKNHVRFAEKMCQPAETGMVNKMVCWTTCDVWDII